MIQWVKNCVGDVQKLWKVLPKYNFIFYSAKIHTFPHHLGTISLYITFSSGPNLMSCKITRFYDQIRIIKPWCNCTTMCTDGSAVQHNTVVVISKISIQWVSVSNTAIVVCANFSGLLVRHAKIIFSGYLIVTVGICTISTSLQLFKLIPIYKLDI